MSSSTRPSLSATYRRRFFQPGSPDWDSPFFEFVPWQFASWQRWRSGTKEVHPEQSTALLSMNPSQLFLVFTNADLLLLLLSNLTPDELNLLIQAGKGKTTLTEDFRRPLMRRHHALWLMGREFSVSEPAYIYPSTT